jgi:hypothetical protein
MSDALSFGFFVPEYPPLPEGGVEPQPCVLAIEFFEPRGGRLDRRAWRVCRGSWCSLVVAACQSVPVGHQPWPCTCSQSWWISRCKHQSLASQFVEVSV